MLLLIQYYETSTVSQCNTEAIDILHYHPSPGTWKQITIIRNSFIHKNANRRYKYFGLLGREAEGPYSVKEHSNFKSKYTEDIRHQTSSNFRFSNWQHFRGLCGKIVPTDISIPMGTHCTPLLADISLYSYKAEFIPSLYRPLGNS